MNLDDAQRKKVAEWIKQGLKLSEIQSRIASELGLHLTYMDVRLLVDDLKLTPKDVEQPKTAGGVLSAPGAPTAASRQAGAPQAAGPAPGPGSVSVDVDQVARAGAVVSGKVTFTDGNVAEWYFDQAGRLGLLPQKTGYRPSASDLQQFQAALDAELSQLGF